MKTKDLVKILTDKDPSGELEVCVNNLDILYVERLPGYYDGASQVFQRDSSGVVTGASFNRGKDKVQISTLSILDLIFHYDNIEIDYSSLSEKSAESLKKLYEDHLKWKEDLSLRHELEDFQRWVLDKIRSVSEDLPSDFADYKSEAEDFFKEKNLSFNLPLKSLPNKNYIECRREQWDSLYEVSFKDGFLNFITKDNL